MARLGSLAEFRQDPKNANKGTERGGEALEASLRQHRFGRSLVADRNGILAAGGKTAGAAARVGLEDAIVVPTDGTRVIVHQRLDLDFLKDPVPFHALGLADNRVGELSLAWDPAILEELQARGVALDGLWTADELAEVLSGQTRIGKTDPDAVPAQRPTSIVAGQIFGLGKHRLVCGDATAAPVVAALLAGDTPLLMTTDPPYGVNYDPAWRRRAGVNNSDRMGEVTNDDRADWSAAWRLFPGDVAYVYHSALFSSVVEESLKRCQFEMRAQIIWRKPRIVLSRGHYHWQHEPCWYAVRHGRTGRWLGKRNQSTTWAITPTVHRCASCGTVEVDAPFEPLPSTIWEIDQRDGTAAATHGTQKPVECMGRAIRNHAAPLVYDPFGGSGTTLIAAEMHARGARMVEIAPGYVQQAIDRWEAFSGAKARKVGEVPPA